MKNLLTIMVFAIAAAACSEDEPTMNLAGTWVMDAENLGGRFEIARTDSGFVILPAASLTIGAYAYRADIHAIRINPTFNTIAFDIVSGDGYLFIQGLTITPNEMRSTHQEYKVGCRNSAPCSPVKLVQPMIIRKL